MALFGKNKKTAAAAEAEEKEVLEETSDSAEAPEKKTAKTADEKTPFAVSKKKNPQYHHVRSNHGARPDAVLLRPRITEKATSAAEHQAYVFEVAKNATKRDVFDAIMHYYNVRPVKINMVNLHPKRRVSRTRRTSGVTSGVRKAYVYLKEGDTIDII